ncbi:MAG: exo-alpha-sialidase [Ignavibacteriales bacterium]|nr:exo-alpha-sialidase [Ignavibacteriales bacterium]
MIKKILPLLLLTTTVFCQYKNIRVNNPSSVTPEEVSIAINPTNPSNLAAGANIRFYYYSNDAGLTWTEGQLSSPLGVWGDPCVTYDVNGNLYFGHLSNPPAPGYWIDRIVVQKSTNGGLSWNSGTGIWFEAPKNQDKEWLAVDMTQSLYRNRLYAAWTEFDSYGSTTTSDSTRILFSFSTDEGNSWNSAVRVSDDGGNCVDSDSTVEGAVPAVGPNGEIYLSWSGPKGIIFDKSSDGGVTWGKDVVVTTQPGGWDFNIEGIYRCNGMPITGCDISNSSYRGNIYIVWSDQRNGAGNTDIFLIKSTDQGETWSEIKRVNDDGTIREQFFPWMTIDQTTGYIYVVFYDRRARLGNYTDVYLAKSTDGGESFTNFRISETSFNPTSNIFFGDYINIAAYDRKIYPIWMRLDGSALSVWTTIIEEPQNISVSYDSGWSMVSIPFKSINTFKQNIFPDAESNAFTFDNGYYLCDSLTHGKGYWIKMSRKGENIIEGFYVHSDTIQIHSGWNMIGSIAHPVPVDSIVSEPGGMITSNFYSFNGSEYIVADTVNPGSAYWVKCPESGKLFLSDSIASQINSKIKITEINELPPPPPVYSEKNIPTEFNLYQNYPNPFNPTTIIEYWLPEKEKVAIEIFNLLGEKIITLVNKVEEPGMKRVRFDGNTYPNGIYYYRLSIGKRTETKKMILTK